MTTTEQPILLAAVSLLSALHLGFQARRVGWSRMKFKILPPAVNGPPEFERTFRAHQNGVEFYPMFLVVLWTSGLFCNEALAALAGLVYVVAREMYFIGYSKSGKGRPALGPSDMENQVELEEKTRLINQVLELQNTLEDLSARVDAVKEENLKLKSENQVLGQYIENLMSASSVFQTTDSKSKRK
ncbi:hypothetical protein NFI96_022623 [Prochilodus magdalenae]|nr:hypothetical protein NFI96_022623 [Prochilodus magdalenae]